MSSLIYHKGKRVEIDSLPLPLREKLIALFKSKNEYYEQEQTVQKTTESTTESATETGTESGTHIAYETSGGSTLRRKCGNEKTKRARKGSKI